MVQVRMDRFGPPEVLVVREAIESAPGPAEVAIRVEAAGVTFVETQVRAGRPPWSGSLPSLPLVLGNGVAGVVESVGPGADSGLLGERVVSATGGRGGYASRVVVAEGALVGVPEALSSSEAVALLADGRTALAITRAAGLRAGDTVLVLAAAGGVGSLLVQLAASDGARVVAGAGSAAKRELARRLGADETVDYTAPGWMTRLVGPVDVLFDGVGGAVGAAASSLVRSGGTVIAFGAASGSFADTFRADERGVRILRLAALVHSPDDNRALVEQALHRAASGRLHPVVGQSYPLHLAGDAHAAIEGRATIGKTVLLP